MAAVSEKQDYLINTTTSEKDLIMTTSNVEYHALSGFPQRGSI